MLTEKVIVILMEKRDNFIFIIQISVNLHLTMLWRKY